MLIIGMNDHECEVITSLKTGTIIVLVNENAGLIR